MERLGVSSPYYYHWPGFTQAMLLVLFILILWFLTQTLYLAEAPNIKHMLITCAGTLLQL